MAANTGTLIIGFIFLITIVVLTLGYFQIIPRHLWSSEGCMNANYKEYNSIYTSSGGDTETPDPYCKTAAITGCTKEGYVEYCGECVTADDTLCVTCSENFEFNDGKTKCLAVCPLDSSS